MKDIKTYDLHTYVDGRDPANSFQQTFVELENGPICKADEVIPLLTTYKDLVENVKYELTSRKDVLGALQIIEDFEKMAIAKKPIS